MADLILEKQKDGLVAGCDEAGRGAWAGPIIAAAVILPKDAALPGVDDSKKINKKNHKTLAKTIMEKAISIGIGAASSAFIDRHGLNFANRYVIKQAIENLSVKPDYLLIDGGTQQKIDIDIPQEEIPKGDQKSLSIAAASIIAKSVHDELMRQYGEEFPEYNWQKNTGYGTMDHKCAIKKHGTCQYHRQSFKPIREMKEKEGDKR